MSELVDSAQKFAVRVYFTAQLAPCVCVCVCTCPCVFVLLCLCVCVCVYVCVFRVVLCAGHTRTHPNFCLNFMTLESEAMVRSPVHVPQLKVLHSQWNLAAHTHMHTHTHTEHADEIPLYKLVLMHTCWVVRTRVAPAGGTCPAAWSAM